MLPQAVLEDKPALHLRVESDQATSPTEVASCNRFLWRGFGSAGFLLLIGAAALAVHSPASPADSASSSRTSLRHVSAVASYVPTVEGRVSAASGDEAGALPRLSFHPSMKWQEDAHPSDLSISQSGGASSELSRRDLLLSAVPSSFLAGIVAEKFGLTDGRLLQISGRLVNLDDRVEQLEDSTDEIAINQLEQSMVPRASSSAYGFYDGYLPIEYKGYRVLNRVTSNTWQLRQPRDSFTVGLGFRKSKDLRDRVCPDNSALNWGSTLPGGVDEGDGWVRYVFSQEDSQMSGKTVYLPKELNGVRVLDEVPVGPYTSNQERTTGFKASRVRGNAAGLESATGIGFRRSKNLEDMLCPADHFLRWGDSMGGGVDQGDGWVRFNVPDSRIASRPVGALPPSASN